MDRLTFGDGASPFVAMATLHRTAQDYGGTDQRAISAIRENFYMDDYRVGGSEKRILRRGDFNLTKWISNSPEVKEAFGAEEAKGMTEVSGEEEGLKVLGVAWKKEDDIFTFQIANTKAVIYTRRRLLSKVAEFSIPLDSPPRRRLRARSEYRD